MLTLNYVAAAFEEEAAFARTPYAGRHRAYVHRTGMFAPRLDAWTPRVLGHDLSPIAAGTIVLALGLAAILLWELLRP